MKPIPLLLTAVLCLLATLSTAQEGHYRIDYQVGDSLSIAAINGLKLRAEPSQKSKALRVLSYRLEARIIQILINNEPEGITFLTAILYNCGLLTDEVEDGLHQDGYQIQTLVTPAEAIVSHFVSSWQHEKYCVLKIHGGI